MRSEVIEAQKNMPRIVVDLVSAIKKHRTAHKIVTYEKLRTLIMEGDIPVPNLWKRSNVYDIAMEYVRAMGEVISFPELALDTQLVIIDPHWFGMNLIGK